MCLVFGPSTGEGAGELAAGPDLQLAIRVREVDLDRLRGDEELLGDLAVGHPVGGEAGDAFLARGQGGDAGEGGAARTRPARRQLAAGLGADPAGAADGRQLDRPL